LITATDPAGSNKSYAMDAFNNLIQVYEAAVGASTYYSYDLLDHLIQVNMTRTSGTQIRTFVYNGNYLTSATNPENGTVTYTYNGYNKVVNIFNDCIKGK
jgi:YD repeat-containing protein